MTIKKSLYSNSNFDSFKVQVLLQLHSFCFQVRVLNGIFSQIFYLECAQAQKEMHTWINSHGNLHWYSIIHSISHHRVVALLGYVDELVLVYSLLARVLGFCHHGCQEVATPGGRGRASEASPGHRGQGQHQEGQQAAQAQDEAVTQAPINHIVSRGIQGHS